MVSPVPLTNGLSPKMVASTAVTTLISIALALLNLLQTNSAMLAGVPSFWQFVILAVIPPLVVGFSAYKASPGDVSNTL